MSGMYIRHFPRSGPLVVVSHPIHNGCLVEIHVVVEFATPLLEEKYSVKNSVVFAHCFVHLQPTRTSPTVYRSLVKKVLLQDTTLAERTDTTTSRVHGHVHVSVYQKPTHGQVP